MPHLFSPFTLKDVTLRNRIVLSPMTMYRSPSDGAMTDFHVMLMGSRAAGGFRLVFPEQIAIQPDGRTSTSCAGLWDDAQIEGRANSAISIHSRWHPKTGRGGCGIFARIPTLSVGHLCPQPTRRSRLARQRLGEFVGVADVQE